MVSLSQFFLWPRSTPLSVYKLEGYMMNTLQTSLREEENFPTIRPPEEFLKRLDAPPKEETSLSTNTDADADKGSFAACLIVRDDNHYLIEWLAYHYHFLPLRRLIVAHDPHAHTSPTEILDRYRNHSLMNITEWNDDDYFDPSVQKTSRIIKQKLGVKHFNQTTPEKVRVATFRTRQEYFLSNCFNQLMEENQTWTAVIDSDEYIVPNWNAAESFRIRDVKPTVYEMLKSPENQNISNNMGSACVAMNRIEFGVKEEQNMTAATKIVPVGFNYSEFFTLRWRYPNRKKLPNGKSMIDLSEMETSDVTPVRTNPHCPSKRRCSRNGRGVRSKESTFTVHHHVGTLEQWTYRDDERNKRTEDVYRTHIYDEGADDSARFWLHELVDILGYSLVSELLHGAGELTPKSDMSS
jgi:hypothetical protein